MHKPILIITHERSGTHLLINTINHENKGEFLTIGFIPVNAKIELFNIENYTHQTYKDIVINSYIEESISKSHHQVEFMEDYLDFVFDKYNVIYLKRDVKDMLCSYYRFLNVDIEYNPIPDFPTLEEWIFSNPKEIGYKYFANYPDPHIIIEPKTYVERWKLHVDGWMKHKDNMLILNYEDILMDFTNTKEKIENYIKRKIYTGIPDINDKDLPNFFPGKGIIGSHKEQMSLELINKINEMI